MDKETFDQILEKIPGLTSHGVGLYEYGTNPQEQIKEAQAELFRELSDYDHTQAVRSWIRLQTKTKGGKYTSYWFKHECENDIGQYVSNGVFIAIALTEGVTYELIAESPNIKLGIKTTKSK